MADLGNFDANTVPADTGFDPLPAGDYVAMIIDSDMKPTKNNAGQYLELTIQVIDGPYTNRLAWDRLTLVHPNHKTVEIAQRKLSAICHAVGVMQVQDSAQLHNRPLVVRLKYVDDPQYGGKNEVSAYKPASGQPAPTQPAAAPAQSAMPWSQQQAPAPQVPAPQGQPAAGYGAPPHWQPPQASGQPSAPAGQGPQVQPWNAPQQVPQRPAANATQPATPPWAQKGAA